MTWVGGTTDGEFAAIGQHLKGLAGTLEARKSWFCLADAVICLGTGITCRDGVPAETVVDNRNLGADGEPRLIVDGVAQPSALGWNKTFRRVRWAYLDGHGGYVFPGGAPLHALREARTGSWHDINSGGVPDPLTRRYLTLWHDHGTDPTDAAYAYALLPGASPRALATRAADPDWLTVLANSRDRQGVAVPSLGLTAVNFWRAATAGPLTATAPASVLTRRHGHTTALHMAGPTRAGTPFEITWARPVRRVTAHDPTIEVLATGRALRLRVTPGTACSTHSCTVETGW